MKPPKVRDAIAHVADLVNRNHRIAESEARKSLQALGFTYQEAGRLVYEGHRKKLYRSDGSSLRPNVLSVAPHLEQDDMTGWWQIFVDGRYAGQRPDKAQAQATLEQLTGRRL